MGDRFENWLKSAEYDLKAAQILLEKGQFHLVAFFSQQVVEKSVKAILYRNNESPWGHSIAELINNNDYLDDIKNIPDREKLGELDLHYITPRYPDSVPNGNPASIYNAEIANRLLTLANNVISYVQNLNTENSESIHKKEEE